MQAITSLEKESMGRRAAQAGGERMRKALEKNGEAWIIVATGASQFEMLSNLILEDIDWSRVTAFHLDEYIGMDISHPASFRKYLKERFVDRLPKPIRNFHYIDAAKNPEAECARLNDLISKAQIDVAFVGIGENGHLAFNDPPADFDTETPYIIVDLDEACRKQQLGEGWFPTFDDVPKQAISMSIKQIMKSSSIICTVPDERKADAVKKTVEGPVTPKAPASILQNHDDCLLFLDQAAAARLEKDHRIESER
ncbi:glucosamine-6-phosphate deaminase [bacterium]|nr:glucosamine-6-phosphate deaminase [bacterium]